MAVSIAAALAEAQVLSAVSDSWRLDAELLLGHVLVRPREWLISHSSDELDSSALDKYRELLKRRQQGEPVAYILGYKGFWDFELLVSPAVLIPRPETELIVETALQLLAGREQEALQIADLGTGSGALAIALARHSPTWQVTASDFSEEALRVAASNAAALAPNNIALCNGSWCQPLAESSYELIVANPPYVEEGDPHLQEDGLPFEPVSALVAADAGLADLREIISGARRCLKANGWLLLEHGYDQQDAVAETLHRAAYVDIQCQRDYAGQARMSQARWPGSDKDS